MSTLQMIDCAIIFEFVLVIMLLLFQEKLSRKSKMKKGEIRRAKSFILFLKGSAIFFLVVALFCIFSAIETRIPSGQFNEMDFRAVLVISNSACLAAALATYLELCIAKASKELKCPTGMR